MELIDFRLLTNKEYARHLEQRFLDFGLDFEGDLAHSMLCSNSFLQSPFWGRFKGAHGWNAHYFCGTFRMQSGKQQASQNEAAQTESKAEKWEFFVLVLSRSVLPGKLRLLSIAYIPFGPMVFPKFSNVQDHKKAAEFLGYSAWLAGWNPFANCESYLVACWLLLRKLLGHIPLSCFFVRLDSNYLLTAQERPQKESMAELQTVKEGFRVAARNFDFRPALQRVQVPTTLMLDLRPSEAELLAQMHKKHRYNIRLAAKKGVQVFAVPWRDGLAEWYRLYQYTAQRDRIGIHTFSYYKNLFAQLEQNSPSIPIHDKMEGTKPRAPSLYLYLAYGPSAAEVAKIDFPRSLGGIIVLHHRAVATYMYGASSDEGRELMPNYLLQWHAICEARKAGLSGYDFFGLPATENPSDPLHGLYRFKMGFGGRVLHRAGAWDFPYSLLFYVLYRAAESIRFGVYWLRHHMKPRR